MERTSSFGKANRHPGPLCVLNWQHPYLDISKKFPIPYLSTDLMCFLESFQCMVTALCFDHRASAWSLYNAMRLSFALYAEYQNNLFLQCGRQNDDCEGLLFFFMVALLMQGLAFFPFEYIYNYMTQIFTTPSVCFSTLQTRLSSLVVTTFHLLMILKSCVIFYIYPLT